MVTNGSLTGYGRQCVAMSPGVTGQSKPVDAQRVSMGYPVTYYCPKYVRTYAQSYYVGMRNTVIWPLTIRSMTNSQSH